MTAEGQATRASLLWRLKSDTECVREIAWREFHDFYAPTIRRLATRLGATVEQADDVVQEVMIGFFAATPEFVYAPSQGRFRGYLKTCVYRALNRYRKRFVLPTLSCEQLDEASAESGKIWDELWEQRLLERATSTYLANCEASKAELFTRSVLDGDSPQTIAVAMNMSIESVYKARQRSLAEFRQILQALTDDEP